MCVCMCVIQLTNSFPENWRANIKQNVILRLMNVYNHAITVYLRTNYLRQRRDELVDVGFLCGLNNLTHVDLSTVVAVLDVLANA